MELVIAGLLISLLIVLVLYSKERKNNKDLIKQITDLREENAALAEKARFSGQLRDLLDKHLVEYLSQTNNILLEQANNKFRQELERYRNLIENTIVPVKDIVSKYQQVVSEYFLKSSDKFSSLTTAINQLYKANDQLRSETQMLVNAFSITHRKAIWGEFQLERLLEAAGLKNQIHYLKQYKIGDSRLDYVIILPDQRKLIIDVKVPLEAYLEYHNTNNEKQRTKSQQNHLKAIKKQIDLLAGKQYHKLLPDSYPYIILYIPVESAFALALSTDPNLYLYAIDKNIILTSPTTIFPLFQIINTMWIRKNTSKNIQQILSTIKEFKERYITLTSYLDDLGKNLTKTAEAYERFIKSWKTRMEPQLRKLEELENKF